MGDPRLHTDRFWRRATRTAQCGVLGGAVLLYALAPNGRALAIGLLLGAVASMARFRLMYGALVRMRSSKGLVKVRLVNYVLSGAALALAFAMADTISPWTTVAGLFAMNASLIATELLWSDSNSHAHGADERVAPRTE
jgi:hypothetical protein